MKRTALAFGAALALLGGCAPYGVSDGYYGGGGYYEPDYYGPTVYAQPYGYGGGYGGGYGREHRDGDHRYRGQDRDHDRGNQGNRSDNRQDSNRGTYQGNNQPAPQNNAQASGGYRMPSGERITRGNFWQQQPQQNAAPQSSGAQPSGDTGGGRMGRHRAD